MVRDASIDTQSGGLHNVVPRRGHDDHIPRLCRAALGYCYPCVTVIPAVSGATLCDGCSLDTTRSYVANAFHCEAYHV